MSGAAAGGGYKREVTESDWAKFGLDKTGGPDAQGDTALDHPSSETAGLTGGGEAQGYDLYSEDQKASEYRPWWKSNFFLVEPVLFGTWDGVFTSVVINIFGVIVFLRTGWMVGNAGIDNSVLILLCCIMLCLMPTLSAIGICERCQIQSGGVYFLISHILGGQIGGAVGVIYAFGQAVGIAMVAVGFGSSMASVFSAGDDPNVWAIRGIAFLVIALLVAINVAGVKWVIKLQLVLLVILGLAVCDFTLGSFIHHNPKNGVVGYTGTNWQNNTGPDYQEGESYFTVLGVFFSSFTGVLAGVNMSGDLKNPAKNIPLGELSAIACSSVAMLLFILILGAVVERDFLINNIMITEQVSWVGFLLLSGLYISSLSSILGSLYGAPRVLQSIAAEKVIPIIKKLEIGRGPNKVPVYATVVILVFSWIFVMVGNLNTLAKISTIPFLITYAFVNYAYVSLAMTFDLQQQRDARFVDGSMPTNYGSTDKLKSAADLDRLFPERQNKSGIGIDEPMLDAGANVEATDERPSIINQPKSWYSVLSNRYVSLFGACLNFIIIFFIDWLWALIYLVLLLFLFVYIGRINPGVYPGISEFSIPHCIRTISNRVRHGLDSDQVVVAPMHPGVDTLASRLTDDNQDYSGRSQFHQSSKRELDPNFD